jgi:GDP-L-fucose synthase
MVGWRLTVDFWENKNILITGGNGFLGSFVKEKLLLDRGVNPNRISTPRSSELDFRVMGDCRKATKGKDIVIHMAATVGGIGFNRQSPATLFLDNALMGIHILEAARQEKVEKVVVLGTVCSYPKFTTVPFKEDDLWNGYPEETNAPYGIAKKILLVQAKAYRQQYGFNAIYLIPVNLYGPRDNFNPDKSHVIPALIRKMVEASDLGKKEVTVWGTGQASREFLFVEDAAEGICLACERYNKDAPINLGSGQEITILDLTRVIASATNFLGEVKWDNNMPDGQPRRRLDVTRASREFGFSARTTLKEGISKTVEWYKNNRGQSSLNQ